MASNEEIYVDGTPISELRVVDLKEQLEKRGLSKTGSKTVLVKRLKDHLALEKLQEEQAGKDPSEAPNMEMKTCGNDFVAEYLEQQQQMLQAAKLAAARSVASSESLASPTSSGVVSTPGTPDGDGRLASPTSSPSKRTKSSRSKSPRQSFTEQESSGETFSSPPPAQVVTSDEGEKLSVDTASHPVMVAEAGNVDLATSQPSAVLEKEPEPESKAPREEIHSNLGDEEVSRGTIADNKKPSRKKPVKVEVSANSGLVKLGSGASEKDDVPLPLSAEPTEEKPEILVPVGHDETHEEDTRRISDTKHIVDSPTAKDAGDDVPPDRLVNNSTIVEKPVVDDETPDNVDKPSARDESVDTSRDNFDHGSTIVEKPVVEPALDEVDDVEMEISAPINAADEIFEAVNTVATPSTEGGERREREKDDSFSIDLDKESRDIPQRKRKWVASTFSKRTAVSITSDSLKDIVPSVKESVKEEEAVPVTDELASPPPKRIVVARDTNDKNASTNLESEESSERRVVEVESRRPVKLTEDGFTRVSSPSPARHPASNLVHVRGLTRPFTISALYNLLSTYGEFSKDEFWIDNIKSHCIVKYSSEAEATLARDRLHNVIWPPENSSSVLRVDFASEEDLERHRDQQAAKVSRRSTDAGRTTSISEKPAREAREIRTEKDDRRRRSASPTEGRQGSWDRGKAWRSGESPPTDPRGAGVGKRLSPGPDKRGAVKREAAPPGKLLDELFHKTKATPCIYWLPLSIEQVKEKERERKKRQEERYERIKRMEEEDRDRRREQYPRRLSPPRRSPPSYRGRRR